ncbi:MAG: uroporphyrinogen-III C-methyltransferase [Planctomycetaceae bacterium]|nr:uroporphyrinogen-III C-methyltransferase [Planctomycetaceae bacterium]
MTDQNSTSTGKVYLVGAGPGDPGLLTLRGAELLAAADVVLYDGLVNPLLLRLATGECERTARTRTSGQRIVPQEEINDRLVAEARRGRMVVRLKGGDPYIFGRGSEEAAALAAAGVDYEVVPGITSATAAGEYAGFSFTHRQIASAVAFVTGHEDPTRGTSHLDYAALAAFPGTVVFYMGLGRVDIICRELIDNGKPSTTPAAVICRASLPQQRVVTGTLATLAQDVKAAGLVPPSLIVVGECVNLRDAHSWFEGRPLFGLNIGITRAEQQAEHVATQICQRSGAPVHLPMISVSGPTTEQQRDLHAAMDQLPTFDWLIFTSGNAVEHFFGQLQAAGKDSRSLGQAQVAAIGPSVVAALQQFGISPDVVPETFRAEALAEVLAPQVNGRRVLWPCASRVRDVLPDAIEKAGGTLQQVVVYNNEDVEQWSPAGLTLLQRGELHWIGLSSPAIARQFAEGLQRYELTQAGCGVKIASISPVTTAAARGAGLVVDVEAERHTWDGILTAIEAYVGPD